jgi:hypothetical protein
LAEVVSDELQVEVEIDNLNADHWRGALRVVVMRAQLRRARIVEIRLLDGGREGERATCIVVDDDGWPAVLGQTPFHS